MNDTLFTLGFGLSLLLIAAGFLLCWMSFGFPLAAAGVVVFALVLHSDSVASRPGR
jgi:hypothetical protein